MVIARHCWKPLKSDLLGADINWTDNRKYLLLQCPHFGELTLATHWLCLLCLPLDKLGRAPGFVRTDENWEEGCLA